MFWFSFVGVMKVQVGSILHVSTHGSSFCTGRREVQLQFNPVQCSSEKWRRGWIIVRAVSTQRVESITTANLTQTFDITKEFDNFDYTRSRVHLWTPSDTMLHAVQRCP